MQRRDEALQATEDALLKQREQEMAIDSEIVGVKKVIQKEQEKNEVLVSTEGKLDAEQRAVDANITACAEKEEKHHERFAMLNRSLEQTDAELAKIATTESSLEHEVAALEAQVQKTLMEAKKVENTIFSTLGEQMAVEKGTQNTGHATEKLRAQREDKEQQQATMQNELARIHVDTLNTKSHNSELDAQLQPGKVEPPPKDPSASLGAPLRHGDSTRRRNGNGGDGSRKKASRKKMENRLMMPSRRVRVKRQLRTLKAREIM